MRTEYKAFHQAIDLLRKDFNKYRFLLKDKRVTQAERLILKSYVEIRNNNYQAVFDNLGKCNPDEDYFKAHKYLLLGIANNNLSNFAQADIEFKHSEGYFNLEVDSHYLFFLYLNWYYLTINIKNKELSAIIIKKIANIKASLTPRYDALKMLVNFDFAANSGKMEDAKKWNEKLKTKESFLYHADLTALIVIRFNFYIKIEDYDNARDELDKLKTIRKNQLTENYKYMSSLLKFLLDDTPLYLREIELLRTPYLCMQLKVLKSMLNHDTVSALKAWEELAVVNASLYRDEFIYDGGNDLFHQCLRKILKENKVINQSFNNKSNIDIKDLNVSINDKLDLIFNGSDILISKDELFEILYGRSASSQQDDVKLAKAISRYRKNTGKEIISKRGFFQFIAIKSA